MLFSDNIVILSALQRQHGEGQRDASNELGREDANLSGASGERIRWSVQIIIMDIEVGWLLGWCENTNLLGPLNVQKKCSRVNMWG